MTRRAKSPMDKSQRRQIARLMDIHHKTHPERLARRFGITAWYCRKLWGETVQEDLAPLGEALEALKSPLPVSRVEGEALPALAQSA